MLNTFLGLVFSTAFLASSISYATPFVLAAMGGIVSERSGVLNLGLEGMMLTGALFAFMGSYYTGNPAVGVLTAIVASMLLGFIHAYSCIELGSNQVVTAVAINIFALGITSALFNALFGISAGRVTAPGFASIRIPLLEKIPVLGTALFGQNVFVYLAYILVPLTYVLFFKTKIGLNIRASGEFPKAANTMGVPVEKVRFYSVIYSSAIAGIAGASLSIAGINMFIENISAGRGFIAFACIILGKFNPIGATMAALLFGMTEGIQLRIQAAGIPVPYQLPLMFPYILTIVMLLLVGSKFSPQSWGVPFFSDDDQ